MNFLLALVIIIAVSKILSEIFVRIGLVSLLGEVITGIILGATFLNIIDPEQIHSFALMGVILLMFLAGYEETDISFLLHKRKKISYISVMTLIATLVTLFSVSKFFLGYTTIQSIFFTFIFGLTDVAVSAKALLSTGHLRSERGETLLGIAVVDTVVGILFLAGAIVFITATSFVNGILVFGQIILFFAVLIFFAKYLPKIIHKLFKFKLELMDISMAFASIFFLAYLAEELKLASVLGAYFAGIILQRARDLETDHFSTTVKSIAHGLFIPIFFTWVVLSIDLKLLLTNWPKALMIIGIVILTKFVYTVIVSITHKTHPKEAFIYAAGMSARGADNLIVIAIAFNLGVLDNGVSNFFSATLVATMLISVLLSSTLLKKLLSTKHNENNISIN